MTAPLLQRIGAAWRVLRGAPGRRRGGYDVARPHRLTSKLHGRLTGLDASGIWQGDGRTLRKIGRYLFRNTGQGKQTVRNIARRVVGPAGIRPQFASPELDAAWRDWAAKAGLRGDSWRALQVMVLSDWMTAGEGFTYTCLDRGAFRVECFEPEALDTLYNRDQAGCLDGIEYDKLGRPVRYFLSVQDWSSQVPGLSLETVTLPAERVQHVLRRERASQLRGISEFAAGAGNLFDTTDAKTSELTALRAAAYFGLHVKPDQDYDLALLDAGDVGLQDAQGNAQQVIDAEPGGMSVFSGDVSLLDANRPGGTFAPFMEILANEWAVSVGIPPHVITGDYSKANYSSLRAAEQTSRETYTDTQQMLIERLCMPVVEQWLEYIALTGEVELSVEALAAQLRTVEWQKPGFPYVDPVKEVQAEREQISLGIRTFDQVCADHGLDGREQRKRIANSHAWDAEEGVTTPSVGWTGGPEEILTGELQAQDEEDAAGQEAGGAEDGEEEE